ncbi:MAG: hypothetical protein LUQ19_02400, partial [Methanoregula sp.]|nr:hypothetical protein [Methanoregula sp.]
QNTKSHKIDKRSGQLSFISVRGWQIMGKVVYEGDDFRRMLRTDMIALQRLVDAKKVGVFEVAYKDKKIKVEITKKGDDIIVKRWRPM